MNAQSRFSCSISFIPKPNGSQFQGPKSHSCFFHFLVHLNSLKLPTNKGNPSTLDLEAIFTRSCYFFKTKKYDNYKSCPIKTKASEFCAWNCHKVNAVGLLISSELYPLLLSKYVHKLSYKLRHTQACMWKITNSGHQTNTLHWL